MNLPQQSQPVMRTTSGVISADENGISPSLPIACILGCVGTTAFKCLHCGTSLGCWAKCAGPDSVGCISGCL